VKIVDPLAPVIVFLASGAVALVAGVAGLGYVVLIAAALAVVFGSVIWVQRKTSDEKPHPERE